jgi:hypothetical protein
VAIWLGVWAVLAIHRPYEAFETAGGSPHVTIRHPEVSTRLAVRFHVATGGVNTVVELANKVEQQRWARAKSQHWYCSTPKPHDSTRWAEPAAQSRSTRSESSLK